MILPHLQNCPHLGDGWCLDCVGKLHAEGERLRSCLADFRYRLVNMAWAGTSHPDNYLIGADDRTAALKAIDALLKEE